MDDKNTTRPADAIVDQWFTDLMHNSGGLAKELQTDAFNRLHAAKDDLKARLARKA